MALQDLSGVLPGVLQLPLLIAGSTRGFLGLLLLLGLVAPPSPASLGGVTGVARLQEVGGVWPLGALLLLLFPLSVNTTAEVGASPPPC